MKLYRSLEVINTLEHNDVYQFLSDRILVTKEANGVMTPFNSLRALEVEIQESLEETLLSRNYMCKLSPLAFMMNYFARFASFQSYFSNPKYV